MLRYFLTLFTLVFTKILYSQADLINKFSLGYGRLNGVVYMSRNVDVLNSANGHAFSLLYSQSDLFRWEIAFQRFSDFDMNPSWKSVKARTMECNLMCLARTQGGGLLFYPIAGLSYNSFNAFYTGIQDYTLMSKTTQPNTVIQSFWPGINTGVGSSLCIGNLEISLQYKMRIGQTPGLRDLNIQDIQFSLLAWYSPKDFKINSAKKNKTIKKSNRSSGKGRYFIPK